MGKRWGSPSRRCVEHMTLVGLTQRLVKVTWRYRAEAIMRTRGPIETTLEILVAS